MARIQDLLDRVLPLAPGAPEAAGVWAYVRASREFFTKTRAWRREYKVPAAAAQTQALATVLGDEAANVEVFDAVQCWYGNERLTKSSAPQRLRKLGTAPSGPPQYFGIQAANVLTIAPAPVAPGVEITLLAVLRPTFTATEIDDALVTKYGEHLENGTLANLLRMPKKPWTDYTAAADFGARFQLEIDRESMLAADDGVGTPRRVRYGGL